MFPISDGIVNAVTGVEQDPDDEADDPTEAVAGVLLQFLLGLVRPVHPVDAERDDEQEDAEADPAGLPQRARAHGRLLRRLDGATQTRMICRVKRQNGVMRYSPSDI